MNKNYSTLKTIFFVVGLLVVCAVAVVTYPLLTSIIWRHMLIWVDVILIYCAVVLPIVLSFVTNKNTAKVFVGGIIYYRGVIVFALLSAAIVVFSFVVPFSMALSIVLQCAAILAFLLYFFLACFTAEHIDGVEDAEKKRLASVLELRNKAENLSISANSLSDEYKSIKESAIRLSDNIRYLSPSNDRKALELESKMLQLMELTSKDLLYLSTQNCSSETINTHFRELNQLYEKRKTIY